METQSKLMFRANKSPKEIKPEITIVRNFYTTAMGMIKEEVIKKVWFIPEMKI